MGSKIVARIVVLVTMVGTGWLSITAGVPALLQVTEAAMVLTAVVGCLVPLSVVVDTACPAGQTARGVED